MADCRARPSVDDRAGIPLPSRLEASCHRLGMHRRGDLLLGCAGYDETRGMQKNLVRGLRSRKQQRLLARCFTCTERAHELMCRLESFHVWSAREVLDQPKIEAVRQPVTGNIAGRIVDRQAPRVDAFERATKLWPDYRVIADHLLEEVGCPNGLGVEASDDRYPLTVRSDKDRRLPRELEWGDQG